jgi:AraC family transcriptional regulator of adaptative response/methylated-DNA-[protein]-cysteine methyltransferase
MTDQSTGRRAQQARHAQDAAVRKACAFIESYQAEGLPTLAEIASHVGLSPSHLQRLFTRIVGVSPYDYAAGRRLDRVKGLLKAGDDVAGALYEAGYGSSSRLYEKADESLGMTPATYKKGGAGATIAYAIGGSALGRVMVAATERGICFVALDDRDAPLIEALRAEFPKAVIGAGNPILDDWMEEVLRQVEGRLPSAALPLDVRATAFQRQVWRALVEIPRGETRTYSQIAALLGNPTAQRAVGRACATNPVSILIPCHRAIREDGGLGGYRWGLGRKEALLGLESETAG